MCAVIKIVKGRGIGYPSGPQTLFLYIRVIYIYILHVYRYGRKEIYYFPNANAGVTYPLRAPYGQ